MSFNNEYINWKLIWQTTKNSIADRKSKDFQWKFIHRIVSTEHKLRLMKKSDGLCTFCKLHEETLSHLFYSCQIDSTIWEKINSIIRPLFNLPPNYSLEEIQIMFGAFDLNKYKEQQQIINLMILTTKWWIWKTKNIIKFQKINQDANDVLKQIRNNLISIAQIRLENQIMEELIDIIKRVL